MVQAMECLMAYESIHGSVEALVLAEASVEAEAGPVVAVGADLVIGNRFKLASNPLGVNCRKDGYYAKRRRYRTYWSGTRHRTWYGSKPGPG